MQCKARVYPLTPLPEVELSSDRGMGGDGEVGFSSFLLSGPSNDSFTMFRERGSGIHLWTPSY